MNLAQQTLPSAWLRCPQSPSRRRKSWPCSSVFALGELLVPILNDLDRRFMCFGAVIDWLDFDETPAFVRDDVARISLA